MLAQGWGCDKEKLQVFSAGDETILGVLLNLALIFTFALPGPIVLASAILVSLLFFVLASLKLLFRDFFSR